MRAFAPYPLASLLLAVALLSPTALHAGTAPPLKATSAAAKECRAIARYNVLSKFATKAFISDCLAATTGSSHPAPTRPLATVPSGKRLAAGN